jgi:hypothetical protein
MLAEGLDAFDADVVDHSTRLDSRDAGGRCLYPSFRGSLKNQTGNTAYA